MLASFDLGPFHTVIALVIAAAKAILIAVFFMHVKRSDRLIQLFSVFGLLWLLILFMLKFSDYFSRIDSSGAALLLSVLVSPCFFSCESYPLSRLLRLPVRLC